MIAGYLQQRHTVAVQHTETTKMTSSTAADDPAEHCHSPSAADAAAAAAAAGLNWISADAADLSSVPPAAVVAYLGPADVVDWFALSSSMTLEVFAASRQCWVAAGWLQLRGRQPARLNSINHH